MEDEEENVKSCVDLLTSECGLSPSRSSNIVRRIRDSLSVTEDRLLKRFRDLKLLLDQRLDTVNNSYLNVAVKRDSKSEWFVDVARTTGDFDYLPSFHAVIKFNTKDKIDLLLCSYNEKSIFAEDDVSPDLDGLKNSEVLTLIASNGIKMCKGRSLSEDTENGFFVERFNRIFTSTRSKRCCYFLSTEVSDNQDQCLDCLRPSHAKANDRNWLQLKNPVIKIEPMKHDVIVEGEEEEEEEEEEQEEEEEEEEGEDEQEVDDHQGMEEERNERDVKDTWITHVEEEEFENEPSKPRLSHLPMCMRKIPVKYNRKILTAQHFCEICLKGFGTEKLLEEHVPMHDFLYPDLNDSIKCPECNELLSSKKLLNPHFRSQHKDIKSIICFICLKYVNGDNLMGHLERIHDRQTVVCTICGQNVRKCYLNKHRYRHHNPNRPTSNSPCPICGKLIKHLDVHLKATHEERENKEHICPHCSKAFGHKFALNEHMKIHQGKNYRCTICAFRTYRSDNVRSHVRKVHGLLENIHQFVVKQPESQMSSSVTII